MKNKREIIESKYPPVNNEDLWLKDGKLYHSTSQGWVPLSEEPSITETYEQGVSSISYSGKDGLEHQIELSENVESDVTDVINNTFVTNSDSGNVIFTDDDNVNHTLVTTDGFNTLLANSSVQEVTWQELKDKRDNGQLIAGSLYRITDYNCTTTQENTQSAGHQFDIVLLALSENKLAEEGWAMMHDNIYDVTFADGVTKKCYLYCENINDNLWNVVDCETLLGYSELGVTTNPEVQAECFVDEETHTATIQNSGPESTMLTEENLTYNYFQNSNLSAWKVWYCLDNDKSRFAWADDSVDEDVPASITNSTNNYSLQRYPDWDTSVYAWKKEDSDLTMYTASETPQVGDSLLMADGTIGAKYGTVASFTPAHEGTGLPNGRGVIYRLIDEWNNDVPYDFKNILYLTKVNAGSFDVNGTEEYIPTFCLYDNSNYEYKDASIFAIEYVNDEGGICPCYNNSINSASAFNSPIDYSNKYCYALPCIIFLSSVESGTSGWVTFDNKLISVYNSTFEGNCFSNIVFGSGTNYIDLYSSFVYAYTRASMESI